MKKRGELRTLRSALRARRRAVGGAVAVGLRFGCAVAGRDAFPTTLEVVDVAARARRGRSRAERTVVPVLVVAGAGVWTPPPSRGSSCRWTPPPSRGSCTRLGASRVFGNRATARATAASVTAAPAVARSTKARPRPGRVAGSTASGRATPGWGVAARGTAVGNCRARASAGSRSSGETSTHSGLIGSAGSSVGSRGVGMATIGHCALARRRAVVWKLEPGAAHWPANLSMSRTVRTRILKSSHGDQFSM